MPEMSFDISWPDGSIERCYSPSLVIKDHLAFYPDKVEIEVLTD